MYIYIYSIISYEYPAVILFVFFICFSEVLVTSTTAVVVLLYGAATAVYRMHRLAFLRTRKGGFWACMRHKNV